MAQHRHHSPDRYRPVRQHRAAAVRRPVRLPGFARAEQQYREAPTKAGRRDGRHHLRRCRLANRPAQRRPAAPGRIPGRGDDHRRHRRRFPQCRPKPALRPRPHRRLPRLHRRRNGLPQRQRPRLVGTLDPAHQRQQLLRRHRSASLVLAAAVGRHRHRIPHRRGLLGHGTRICRQPGRRCRHLVAGLHRFRRPALQPHLGAT